MGNSLSPNKDDESTPGQKDRPTNNKVNDRINEWEARIVENRDEYELHQSTARAKNPQSKKRFLTQVQHLALPCVSSNDSSAKEKRTKAEKEQDKKNKKLERLEAIEEDIKELKDLLEEGDETKEVVKIQNFRINVDSYLQKRRPKISAWLVVILSSLLHIADTYSDLHLSISYLRSNYISWGMLSFLFCFVPWVFQLLWGLSWALKIKITKTRNIGILLSVLNLHIPHAEFHKLSKMKVHTDSELAEDSHHVLKLKETIRLCEDMPQLILQLYIIGRRNEMSAHAFYSILTSFLSIVVVGVMLKINKEREIEIEESKRRVNKQIKRRLNRLERLTNKDSLNERGILHEKRREKREGRETDTEEEQEREEETTEEAGSGCFIDFLDSFKDKIEIYLTYTELRKESEEYIGYKKIRDCHPPLCFNRFFKVIRKKYDRIVQYLVLIPYHLILAFTSMIAISCYCAVDDSYWPILFFCIPWLATVQAGKLRRMKNENTYITLGTIIACALRFFESIVINFFLAGWFVAMASALTQSGKGIPAANLTRHRIVPSFVWPDTINFLEFMKHNGSLPIWAKCNSSMLNGYQEQSFFEHFAEFLNWIWNQPICVTDLYVLVYQIVFVSSLILPFYELFIISLL